MNQPTRQHNSNTTSVKLQCRHCQHASASVVLMPPGATHYAAARCGNCDLFLQWLPKPENATIPKRRGTIQKLLESAALTGWERDFLNSIQQQKKLSPKQQAVLANLEAKLGGVR